MCYVEGGRLIDSKPMVPSSFSGKQRILDPGREIRGKESGDEAEASIVQGEEGMAWIAAVSLILRHQAAWTGKTYLPLLHPRDLSNHPGGSSLWLSPDTNRLCSFSFAFHDPP